METLEAIKHFLKALGLNIILLIGGFFGALVSLKKDNGLTVTEKLFTLISGSVVANYLTPIISNWTGSGENTEYGFAFLLGYLGLKSIELIISEFKKKFGTKISEE